MSNIDKQALREEFRYMRDHYNDPADRKKQEIYIAAEALLDELDKKQQYIKLRDQENEDIALTVGKLRVELEAAKKRIAELEKGHQEAAKQINSWRRLAKQNIAERGKDISELEAARQRIAELENSETQLINERDAAESALADMYQAATGERPEWSNMFGFADAVDVVEERLATLEANQSQTTPTGIQLITEAIGAHGYIVGCLLQGRPDLALEESRKWVSAFGQAAEIVSAQDATGIKVKGE
ncbi:ead/Ea22-like family protein [Salmonella enterica]|nr:ead/Ea22-like family protein [Salmonella enterica]EEG0190617.1 ead/Ea22-like family protein [Salmonella enterica]EJJ7889692.1 ead/Ea22-like family protein [Salmonella enterica]EJS5460588.1 ead/Ea22-like family protein [Salmonella enterica]EJY6200390.1 ead/Ea22-like family protein [Salmonella enterica]